MSKLISKLSGKKDKDAAANDSASSNKISGNNSNTASPVSPSGNSKSTSTSTTGATAPTGGSLPGGTATGSAPPPTTTAGSGSSAAAAPGTGAGAASGGASPAATGAGTGTAPTSTSGGNIPPTTGGTGAVPSGTTTSSAPAPTSAAANPTERSAAAPTSGAQAPGTTTSHSAAAPAAASGAAGAAVGAAGAGVAGSHSGTHPGEAASAGNPAIRPAPRQANIAIVVWSLYGHVAKLAEEVAKGVQASGAKLTIYQFEETLPDEVIAKMYGNKAPIASLPVITPDALKQYDGFLLGFPTRYGRAPAQVSAFFDKCGGVWMSGGLIGKFAGIFTSSASQHGGQETTALTTMPWLAHMGVNYVPLGVQCPELTAIDSVQGGSWWGASTVAAGDGHLQPTTNDLSIAQKQGMYFGKLLNQFVRGAEQ